VADRVAPEVHVIHRGERGGALRVVIENNGSEAVEVVVRANAYVNTPPRRHVIAPGEVVEDRWGVDSSLGWYDLSVTTAASPAFLRRAAGRVETGEPSVSDPANSARG